MYTDEQIAKMTPKAHPAIKMANSWNTVLTEQEYKIAWKKLEKWVLEQQEFIVEKYGKKDGDLFLKLIAPSEIIPFVKAGFNLDYDYLTKLIHESKPSPYLPFLEQDLAVKLVPIRESMTTIALTSNAIWGLKPEFGSDISTIKQKTLEITGLAKDCLILLAQGEMGELKYLSKIEQMMREDCKTDKIPTATFIKALKSAKHQINSNVYKERSKGFINEPEELIR